MTGKNKFGFDPVEPAPVNRRRRDPGPMSAAVRETAGTLAEETEAKMERRKQNARDAKAFREAEADGRVLVALPVDEIYTDDLPRDRMELEAVAVSDEMEELKTSISMRGQREPIEVYVDGAGHYQLKKGWRRLTALRQLFAVSGDPEHGQVIARINTGIEERMGRYIDMVEENVVREDLSFAEMAQVAIVAADDPGTSESDADAMVGVLYASLHKMKRSYIRQFVFLLRTLGDDLKWPKSISRNLGVDLARGLRSGFLDAGLLRASLGTCGSPEEQNALFSDFLTTNSAPEGQGSLTGPSAPTPQKAKEKFEFRLGETKVTARRGEFRITNAVDFASYDRDTLEMAVRAFERVLKG